jgi:hypothetical protein
MAIKLFLPLHYSHPHPIFKPPYMPQSRKIWLLVLLTLTTLVAIFAAPPIPQALSFHHFADDRALWGIPNFGNVTSNLPFLIVAIIGLVTVVRSTAPPAIRATYALLFVGVLLTGLGSAYYHWNPNNDTLVWDRIPMTIVFMSLLAAAVSTGYFVSLFRGQYPYKAAATGL